MLTWADVLKLLVPVITAFAVIWARGVYERWSERKSKEECLWRGLHNTSDNLINLLRSLEAIAEQYEAGKAGVMQIEVPKRCQISACASPN